MRISFSVPTESRGLFWDYRLAAIARGAVANLSAWRYNGQHALVARLYMAKPLRTPGRVLGELEGGLASALWGDGGELSTAHVSVLECPDGERPRVEVEVRCM